MSYPIVERLSSGTIGLAKMLIREKIDFFPLLFYVENDQVFNSTVANDSENADYETIISKIVEGKGLQDYMYAINELDCSRFSLNVCVSGVLYSPVYMYYREINGEMEFSDLITE